MVFVTVGVGCRWSKLFILVGTDISSAIVLGVNFLVVGVCCVFLMSKLIFQLCGFTVMKHQKVHIILLLWFVQVYCESRILKCSVPRGGVGTDVSGWHVLI